MADTTGAAWVRIAREVAPTLPGTWVVRGGRGVKAVLVREPYDWSFSWVGLYRVRAEDDPYLMAGVVPLVTPDPGFAASYGLRSDRVRHRPPTVNMLAEDAAERVRLFIVEDALPRMHPWNDEALAASAEENCLGDRPGFEFAMLQSAGWRVLTGTGSPVEPARVAVEHCKHVYAPELVPWYEALSAAWENGGRTSALQFLQEHRSATLKQLKLV